MNINNTDVKFIKAFDRDLLLHMSKYLRHSVKYGRLSIFNLTTRRSLQGRAVVDIMSFHLDAWHRDKSGLCTTDVLVDLPIACARLSVSPVCFKALSPSPSWTVSWYGKTRNYIKQ